MTQLSDTERDLAAFYVHRSTPPGERLPLEKFRDPVARAILEIVADLEAEGKPVDPITFPKAASKADRPPCEPGELVAIVSGSNSAYWGEAIRENAEAEVLREAERRETLKALDVARAKIEAGEPLEAVHAILPHHTPPITVTEEGDDDPPQPCPIEALDGLVAGDMAREVARVAAVPEALAVASVLGVASGAIGAGLRVRTWAAPTGANLWFLPVARTCTGKGRAADLAAAPLLEIEGARIEAWKADTVPDLEADLRIIRAQLAELDKELKADAGPENKRRVKEAERRRSEIEEALAAEPSMRVGNITKEELATVLSRQPGEATFAFSSEARGILDVIAGRYSKTGDEDLWLSGFSGDTVKVSRVGKKPVTLSGPCVSVLFMIQPDAFRRCAARPEMAESGFLGRFLPFDTKARPQGAPDFIEPLDGAVAEAWRARIEELVTTFRDKGDAPTTIEFEPDAKRLLRNYANEIKARREGDLVDLDGFAGRWAEIACRLALVLHAIEHGAGAGALPVSAMNATRAHLLLEWFTGEAVDLLGDLRESRGRERRDKLRALLEGAASNEMTLRDLKRRHGFEASEIEAILPKIGGVVTKRQGARGAPSTVAKLLKGPMP